MDKKIKELCALVKKNERKRILIMCVKKQTSFIKNGMVGGSCGLTWLIDELKDDKYE